MDWSIEQAVCFTGHRPNRLGGYDMKNPTMMRLKERLLVVIEELIVEKGYVTFISGGALGLDQAAFWCVEILKKKYPHIQNILASPYLDQGRKKEWDASVGRYVGWSEEQALWYEKMRSRADMVIYVDGQEGYGRDHTVSVGRHSNRKLMIRNEYMVDHADLVVAVWDGVKEKSGTWNCIRYAHRHSKEMIFINPSTMQVEPINL